MTNTYTLDSQHKTPPPLHTERPHNHVVTVIAIIGAIIIAASIWYGAMQQNTASTNQKPVDLRAQVSALLQSTPVHYTQDQIDHMSTLLENSKVTVTDTDRARMSQLLR